MQKFLQMRLQIILLSGFWAPWRTVATTLHFPIGQNLASSHPEVYAEQLSQHLFISSYLCGYLFFQIPHPIFLRKPRFQLFGNRPDAWGCSRQPSWSSQSSLWIDLLCVLLFLPSVRWPQIMCSSLALILAIRWLRRCWCKNDINKIQK